jgi:predicted kinase
VQDRLVSGDRHQQKSATFVVVTGPPGAGKTTVAAALRDQLGYPLVAKDTLKESLGESLGITEPAKSKRLGVAVFEVLTLIVRELVANGVSVIAEGNFTNASSLVVDPPSAEIVQVHVTAAPEILRERLLARDPSRHPVHYDAESADSIAERLAAGEWDPLALPGRLIEIDTSEW